MSKRGDMVLSRADLNDVIRELRGQKVILDRDLAVLYGVPTKALNQALKRNLDRFPPEFAFQLTIEELASLRSQIVTSKTRGGVRYLPFAFTEHGALMAANILHSRRAIQMSVAIVQTFVRMRRLALSFEQLVRRVEALEHTTGLHSADLQQLMAVLRQLMHPPAPVRREIGFHVREAAPPQRRTKGDAVGP